MTPHASLTRQLLEWIAERPHTYTELLDTWKTSCPRLAIWEDACADGLIESGSQRDSVVTLTDKGRHQLNSHG